MSNRNHSGGVFRFLCWVSALLVLMAGAGTVTLMSQVACSLEYFVLNPSSATFAASGGIGQFSWAKPVPGVCPTFAVPLVPWITINGNNSSTNTSGSVQFSVQPNGLDARSGAIAVNPGLVDRTDLTIIQAGGLDPIITSPSNLPGARQGAPYQYQFTWTTGVGTVTPHIWSGPVSGSLPQGLSLNSNGLLSGSALESGMFSFSVSAQRPGSIYTAKSSFTLTVTASQGNQFYTVTPCRVVDTRIDAGKGAGFGPPHISANNTREFLLPQGACGLPPTAEAYSLNVTVAPRGPLAFLTIWPSGVTRPEVSTLNAFDGAVVANAAIVPAGANKGVNVFASNDTEVIIDINGYFAPPIGSGLSFYPLRPCRVADTRASLGQPAGLGPPAIAGGTSRSFPVRSSNCGIPATAQAYSMNMTAVPPGPMSFLTTWPTGQAQPLVSTLNAFDGRVVANAALIPAGTNGEISVFASNQTDVVIDINGYFAPPGAPGALGFYVANPCRVADTRPLGGKSGAYGPPGLSANVGRDFSIPGSSCGIPATAQAYSLNMTVVPPGPLAFLTTWPAGQQQPLVSTLNSFAGKIVANAALVPAGVNGAISVSPSNPTDLIIDINGYFAP
jgi:hypothetical protein